MLGIESGDCLISPTEVKFFNDKIIYDLYLTDEANYVITSNYF